MTHQIMEDPLKTETDVSLPTTTWNPWSFAESTTLIDLVESHYNMMYHPLKKKNLWNIIASEMEGFNYIRRPKQCKDKWRNLLRTYKSCQDNINRTSDEPIRFEYYDKMHAFLTKDVIINSSTIVGSPVKERVDRKYCSSTTIERPIVPKVDEKYFSNAMVEPIAITSFEETATVELPIIVKDDKKYISNATVEHPIKTNVEKKYSSKTIEGPVIARVDKNRKRRLIQQHHHHLPVTPEKITNALGNYLAFKIDYLKKKEKEKEEEREKRQQRHNEKVEILSRVLDIFKEKH